MLSTEMIIKAGSSSQGVKSPQEASDRTTRLGLGTGLILASPGGNPGPGQEMAMPTMAKTWALIKSSQGSTVMTTSDLLSTESSF